MTIVQAETGQVVELLTKQDAEALTAKIKGYAGSLYRLLAEAHDGQAWRAMGYTSWSSYVATEFDMSRSRAYQLVSHARVVAELDAEVSTMVDTLTERDTRRIAPVIGEVKAEIAAEVAKIEAPTDEDRAEVTREVVTRFKEKGAAKRAAVVPPKPEPQPIADPVTRLRKSLADALHRQTDLLRLDPVQCAAVIAADDQAIYRQTATEMQAWATALLSEMNRPLRSVQ